MDAPLENGRDTAYSYDGIKNLAESANTQKSAVRNSGKTSHVCLREGAMTDWFVTSFGQKTLHTLPCVRYSIGTSVVKYVANPPFSDVSEPV